MAKLRATASIEAKITLELTVEEANALYNMTVYGHEPFTEWFYKHLGKHYLKPFHNGIISLFKTVKEELPSELKRINEAEKLFKK